MKKIILFTFFILFSFSFASAQQRNCGTIQHLQYLKGNDLQLENKMMQNEIALQSWIQTLAAFNSMNSTIITIPVVVHVVYYNSTENISTAQVQSQIDILNEDFRRLNADASNTPSIFQAVAADTEIEFCLATTDPNGNSTTGITRTSTSQTSFSTNDGVKYSSSGGVNAWNTAKYLNIWVCDISGGILGYAQFPGGPSSSDGVVCDYAYFGNIGTATSPYDLGRTATHEVGHWLNLRHIWGDSNCGNDYCNDTPLHNTENYGCPSYPHLSTCSGTPIEMTMNYMDYTDDACMNMFSQDQKTRMIAAINTSRSGLLTSNGCQGIVYSCTVTAASSSPALCINTPLTPNITHTTTVATGIGVATGLPSGVSALFTGTATSGTITISGTPTVSGVFNYSIPLTGCTPQLFATGNITVNPLPTVSLTSGGASITTASVCVGSTLQLYGTATAATTNAWISATPAKATINVSTGLVTGVAAGTSVITYTNSNGCTKTVTVTVNPLPTVSLTSGGASITTASVCVGSTLQLYGTATAATTNAWLSATPAKATINVSTGLVTGVAAGTSVITYTNSNGCTKTVTVTVNSLPTVSLTSGGASITTASVCVGATLQLYGTATPATTTPWTTSAAAVATINNTGLVTGVSAGTTTITYKNSNGCTKTVTVTVTTLATNGSVTTSICAGSSYTWPANGVTYTTAQTGVTVVTGCNTASLNLTITPLTTPTFAAVGPFCSGTSIPALATSSTNIPAITGTWSPAINNTATTTYTFTPTSGQCAITQNLSITVNPIGCTDPTATNYNPNAVCDNGSCTLPTTCTNAAPTGLFVDGIIHTRATINWTNMNSTTCFVDQYRIQYRKVGTTPWLSKTMGAPLGTCGANGTTGIQKTDKELLDLLPSTTYQYQMKAWYCGGGVSSWTTTNTFTTAGNCPNISNLTVTTPTTTKATFTWSTSNGAYSFVRLKARVDTLSNPVDADWFMIGGSGVNYPAVTKDKNGLLPGQTYRGQGRTFCDPNGGAYMAPSWTPLVTWTQPTSIRLEGGESIANLDVYPNPSRDVFNISFTSETVQNLKLRVLNVVGEEIILEDLQQFVGEYTKSIDLATYTKGVYFLEITTDNGVVNKKLILQ